MCFKYEDEYPDCFDHLMFDDVFYTTDLPGLLGEYGIEITDKDKFEALLYAMFEQAHEQGIIKPGQTKLVEKG